MSHVLPEMKEPLKKAILNLSGDKGIINSQKQSLSGFPGAEGVKANSQSAAPLPGTKTV